MPMPKADNSFLESSTVFDVSFVTAVITGGGSGLGLMMTQVCTRFLSYQTITLIWQALVANGAKVYIVDRRESALRTVVDLYDTKPGQIIPSVIPPFSSADVGLADDELMGVGSPPISARNPPSSNWLRPSQTPSLTASNFSSITPASPATVPPGSTTRASRTSAMRSPSPRTL
jgi:hypothetical protein